VSASSYVCIIIPVSFLSTRRELKNAAPLTITITTVFTGVFGHEPAPEMFAKCCHDMRFDSCECGVNIRLRLGLPDPAWELTALPRPLVGFKGGEGEERKGGEGKGGRIREGTVGREERSGGEGTEGQGKRREGRKRRGDRRGGHRRRGEGKGREEEKTG